ncbi:MAG: TIR domain-containing protein [Rikenellaceae bacterium]|nr:TIR domain-containing protein [Rikenellaceae bacterium]
MKYDVFISYSRKDTNIADRICKAFDDVGIVYFIDRQGIGGGVEFPDKLADAIVNSSAFLLLGSNNSYNSPFTKREVTFAFNKKRGEQMLPYLIDNTPLPSGLELVFSSINWRNIKEHPIETVLVDDILRMLGRTRPARKESAPRPAPKPVPPAKTYKVGDSYDENGKRGVVFEVSADGKHGKIVSFNETKLQWANEKFDSWREKIGAYSETNGAVNMAVVQRIPNWRGKYPAFAWCADLGEGWYLPAIDELKAIYDIRNILNAKSYEYWSSTESKRYEFSAWYVRMYNGYTYTYDYVKFINYYVRAVSAF